MKNSFSAIVLAGGKGKRMNSTLPKVLHRVGSVTMLERTVKLLKSINPTQTIVVCNKENILSIQKVLGNQVSYATQTRSNGTADAVSTAINAENLTENTIGIFYGDDTSLYKAETIKKVYSKHLKSNAAITFITVIKQDPTGLGRIVRKNSKVLAIVEEKDANESQLKIKEVSDGVYFFQKKWLVENVSSLTPSKATGELYLTDLIELAISQNQKVETYTLEDSSQWQGINSPIELAQANLKLSKKIHFMGISGAGAAAVAGIARGFGYDVTGCDINKKSPYTSKLNVPIEKGHNISHIEGISVLIVSPAVLIYDPQNPELVEARAKGIPIVTWQEFQGKILQGGKFVIAVAGAYGKSTTTAMIAKILTDARLDPTCEIGAAVLEWEGNFRIGNSRYYICEADEYFNNFLNYKPDIAVILNTKWEHPDFFKSPEDLADSYQKFIKNIKVGGKLIISKNDQKLASVQEDTTVINVEDFNISNLSLIGDFRRENANFALTVAKTLNLDLKKATQSVISFKGLGRRLEKKGEIGQTVFYDDYAVQPYTIKTTANALAAKFGNKKVLLVLEPHMHSRIKRFFSEFVSALESVQADIYITDVFTAREKSENENISKRLQESLGQKAKYTGSIENTAQVVAKNLKDYDVVLSMGAGDVYKLYDLTKVKNG